KTGALTMMREALTCASVPDQHVYFSELQTMAPLTRVKPQIFSSFFQQSELSRIRPLNNINQVSKRRNIAEIRTLPLRNEKNCRKGRNNKADLRNRALVQRPDCALVPDIAAAVERGIAVEDLAPRPRKWHFDAIIAIHLGGEVHHHQATVVRLVSLSQPREPAAFGIMHDQPLEPGIFAIEFVQGRYRPVKPIEIADQSLHALMPGILEKMPIKRMVMAPFTLLTEFAAHEHQFLAGMTEHEAVVGAQVGKALPFIARHAAENRTLAVHDLVMGER